MLQRESPDFTVTSSAFAVTADTPVNAVKVATEKIVFFILKNPPTVYESFFSVYLSSFY